MKKIFAVIVMCLCASTGYGQSVGATSFWGSSSGSGSGTVNAGTAGHLGYYATSAAAISDMGADWTFATHTITGGASAVLDLSAATITNIKFNGTGFTNGHLLGATVVAGVLTLADAGAVPGTATTVNGQTCTLGSTCNVNNGAAQYSVAINGAAGAAIQSAALAAGNILTGGPSGTGANPVVLSLAFVASPTWNSGSTMAWDLASAPYGSLSLSATHNTTSTLNPSHLINGGQYLVAVTQDGTGTGTTVLGLGTAGTAPTCAAWIVLNTTDYAVATTVGVTATASHGDVLTFTYDGTNCWAAYH